MVKEEGHEGQWITMNGNHVFIRSNETIETALARDIKGGEEHGTRKEKQTEKPESKAQAHKKEYERRKKEFYDKADPGGKLKGQMKGEMKKPSGGQKYWEGLDKAQKQNIMTRIGLSDHAGIDYNEMPANVKRVIDERAKNIGDAPHLDKDDLKGKMKKPRSVMKERPKGIAKKEKEFYDKADPGGEFKKKMQGFMNQSNKPTEAPGHPAQSQFHDYLKDSAFSKDFEEFNKKPHGPTPSGMGYHKEDLHSHLGRAQMILNYLHKNPNKTFDPFSSLPDQITSQIHPNEFESSMSLLTNSDVARGSGLGVKLDKKFKPAPKPKASPDSFKSNMQNFMKKQKGSMSKINTKLNTLKIASMKLATSN